MRPSTTRRMAITSPQTVAPVAAMPKYVFDRRRRHACAAPVHETCRVVQFIEDVPIAAVEGLIGQALNHVPVRSAHADPPRRPGAMPYSGSGMKPALMKPPSIVTAVPLM